MGAVLCGEGLVVNEKLNNTVKLCHPLECQLAFGDRMETSQSLA